MEQKSYVITDETGIHARPATMLNKLHQNLIQIFN